jgi:putative transposase
MLAALETEILQEVLAERVQATRIGFDSVDGPCSFKPDAKWMARQADAIIEQARAGLPMKRLVLDRDGMYVRDFNDIFERAGVSVEPTAPRAPNQNAFIERWIRSIQVECLNHFIVLGKEHFDHLVSCYLSIYNSLRS